MKRKHKLSLALLIIILIIAVIVYLKGCGGEDRKEQTKIEARNIPTVLVALSQQHQFNTSVQITGIAKPNQSVKLYAMTSGFLQQLKADIGDFVKDGQTLAVLDNPELFRDKEKIEADLKAKKSIYERLKSIYDKTPQLTTIAEVEKAEAGYQTTNAQLNGLLLQIGYLNVKAPFSGVITNRYVDKGAVIQSGLSNSNAAALFEIQDLQPIRLEVDIPETDAELIDKNTKADITFPELPNTKYTASVSRVAYGLNEETKTMKIQIDLPNKDLKIRPGMYATLQIKMSGHKDVRSVPNEAIGNIKGQSFVYVVENKTVKKVNVETGIRDEKFTELLNAPIKEADSIVVQGKDLISDGATVQTKFVNNQ